MPWASGWPFPQQAVEVFEIHCYHALVAQHVSTRNNVQHFAPHKGASDILGHDAARRSAEHKTAPLTRSPNRISSCSLKQSRRPFRPKEGCGFPCDNSVIRMINVNSVAMGKRGRRDDAHWSERLNAHHFGLRAPPNVITRRSLRLCRDHCSDCLCPSLFPHGCSGRSGNLHSFRAPVLLAAAIGVSVPECLLSSLLSVRQSI